MTEGMAQECFVLQGESQAVCPKAATLAQVGAYVGEKQQLRDRIAAERGTRLRPLPTTPYEKFAAVVDAATSDAYFTYSRYSGVGMSAIRQRPHSCRPAQVLLQHELRKRGIETVHMYWTTNRGNHHFLRTAYTREPLILDPTWQQFLPEGSDYDSLAHTMILPASRLEEGLEAYGVAEYLHIWHDAQPAPLVNQRSRDDYHEPFYARIFADDPWRPPLRPYEQVFYGGRKLYTPPAY